MVAIPRANRAGKAEFAEFFAGHRKSNQFQTKIKPDREISRPRIRGRTRHHPGARRQPASRPANQWRAHVQEVAGLIQIVRYLAGLVLDHGWLSCSTAEVQRLAWPTDHPQPRPAATARTRACGPVSYNVHCALRTSGERGAQRREAHGPGGRRAGGREVTVVAPARRCRACSAGAS